MGMKQAVLFDLDGVIVNTAVYHYRAWKRLADGEGIPFDEAVNERLKGVSRMRSLEIILERADRAYTEEEKQALCSRKNAWYVESVSGLAREEILPGAEELLQWLRRQGLKTALCSASRSAETIVRRLGLADCFDYIADAGKLTRQKPDPEIFVSAADCLGAEYGACVVVEDSRAGLEAARSCGMRTVGIGNGGLLGLADCLVPDLQGEHLERIKAWIKG